MAQPMRRTVVAPDRFAIRERRLAAARMNEHGLQVLTFEQLAARMAGGLLRPVDDETLRAVVQAALPETALGELEALKALPGLVGACVDTLKKVWRAGVDLQARRDQHPRLAALAALETAVLANLPSGMTRPVDLVNAASGRLRFSPAVVGPLEIVGVTELAPCWRQLLRGLGEHVPVRWIAGPRGTPDWLDGMPLEVVREPPQAPELTDVSAATAYHEAVEALRWARGLIASGVAEPAEIAIAAVTPADYDDHFLALRADANLDLHFVHGVPVTTTRPGQAAAALADILVRGLTQTRLRRLVSHIGPDAGPFRGLPEGWLSILPRDAPLASQAAWTRLLKGLGAEAWPDGVDHGGTLARLVDLLLQGPSAAEEAGETLLQGQPLAIWRKALRAGPASSLDLMLEALRLDDGLQASVGLAWAPASAVAASPRPFVRLLGLNSSRWPRGLSEDRLIPDHVVPGEELDPLPPGAADRRDFETILRTASRQVVMSRSRRDSDGRLLGRSPLLAGDLPEAYLLRNRVPEHAFSETDRLAARPVEYRARPSARSADQAWRDWRREALTAHDGLVAADHPVIQAITARVQSASSLRLLLRNPLGFLWRYGLHMAAPESGQEPLVLDALAFGQLVHLSLDLALRGLETDGGLSAAPPGEIAAAAERAVEATGAQWQAERATPPRVIWRRSLDEVRNLVLRALTFGGGGRPDGSAFSEVAFGGAPAKSDSPAPWDPATRVEIPGTGFRIAGYIDRLDVSADGRRVKVQDYKTGRTQKEGVVLDGGRELQRCLYAFAARALLGEEIGIEASLLFLKEGVERALADPPGALDAVVGHLAAARTSLLSGAAAVGPDAAGDYDDLAFALPANARATYQPRKLAAARERLGDAALIWETP